jgi:hypothetical protein
MVSGIAVGVIRQQLVVTPGLYCPVTCTNARAPVLSARITPSRIANHQLVTETGQDQLMVSGDVRQKAADTSRRSRDLSIATCGRGLDRTELVLVPELDRSKSQLANAARVSNWTIRAAPEGLKQPS